MLLRQTANEGWRLAPALAAAWQETNMVFYCLVACIGTSTGETVSDANTHKTRIPPDDSNTQVRGKLSTEKPEDFDSAQQDLQSSASTQLVPDENVAKASYAKDDAESSVRGDSTKDVSRGTRKKTRKLKSSIYGNRQGMAKPVFDHPRLRPRTTQNVNFDDLPEPYQTSRRPRSRLESSYGKEELPEQKQKDDRLHFRRVPSRDNSRFQLTLGGYQLSSPDESSSTGAPRRPIEAENTSSQSPGATVQPSSNGQNVRPMPPVSDPSGQQVSHPAAAGRGFGTRFHDFPTEVVAYNMAVPNAYSRFPDFSHGNFHGVQSNAPVSDYNVAMLAGLNSNEVNGHAQFDPNTAYKQGNFGQSGFQADNPFAYQSPFVQTFQQSPERMHGFPHFLVNSQRPDSNPTVAVQSPNNPVVGSPAFYNSYPQTVVQQLPNSGQQVYHSIPGGFPTQFTHYPGYSATPNTVIQGPVTVVKEVEYTTTPEKEVQRSETVSREQNEPVTPDHVLTTTADGAHTSSDLLIPSPPTEYATFGQRLNTANTTTTNTTRHMPPFPSHYFYHNIPWMRAPPGSEFPPSHIPQTTQPPDGASDTVVPNQHSGLPNTSPVNGTNGFDATSYFKNLHFPVQYGQVLPNEQTNFFLNYPSRLDVTKTSPPLAYNRPFYDGNQSKPSLQDGEFPHSVYGIFGNPASRHDMKAYDGSQRPACSLESGNSSVCFEDKEYPRNEVLYALESESLLLRRLLPNRILQGPEKGSESNEKGDTDSKTPPDENNDVCEVAVTEGQPLRAENAEGKWKILVNAGVPGRPTRSFFQKVRLELCKKTEEACSYTDSSVATKCMQKYTLSHLLAWEPLTGLHMDAFKLPVACSCQIIKPTPEKKGPAA